MPGDAASSEAQTRWNARYSERGQEPIDSGPPPALTRLYERAGLSGDGLAIDLAGGDGRGVLWLAGRGFTPALVEVSDVALGLATDRATSVDIDLLTVQMDLEGMTVGAVLDAVRSGRSDDERLAVICCFHYLNRHLLASVIDELPPGSTFLASIATRTNLERHSKPSARFLLEPGELRDLVVPVGRSNHLPDLELIHHFEGWNADGFHEAEIIVRRPRHSSDWAERPMHKDRSQR